MSIIKFGTDGWRGMIARDFTFESCRTVAQGIAGYVKQNNLSKKGIIVAYDNRFLSEEFARETCLVLTGNGIKTFLLNKPTPTPVAAFAIKSLEAGGAVVITASHNPPEFSGIKFIPFYAGPALPEVTIAIVFEINKVLEGSKIYQLDLGEAEALGLFSEMNLDREYSAHVQGMIQARNFKDKKLKFVVDPMFGSGINYLEKNLTILGCEVKNIHNYRDPLFGGIIPEPLEEPLCDLKRSVVSYNADLGLAMDGDADRFGIVDKDGQFVSANTFLAILLQYLIEYRPYRGPICRTQGTTHMLDRIARKYNLGIIETPVGFKYISACMREKGCLLGGEESGGLSIMGHIPEKDGILAGLLAAEITATTGKTMAELKADLCAIYGPIDSRRYDLKISPQDLGEIKEKLDNYNPKSLKGLKIEQAVREDGLKLFFEDESWILLRLSGTESLLRIYIESESFDKNIQLRDLILKGLELL